MPTCVHLAAFLLAGAFSLPAQESLHERVGEALDRARPVLLEHLEHTRAGMLALSCLAAVHDDISLREESFQAAIERLSRSELDSTYELALRLMVMAEHPEFPDREELAREDTITLMQRQTAGGFSYRPNDGWWDMSNTQYAALGLRAAVSLGREVPLQRWRLLFRAVSEAQTRSGGFSYRGSSAAYSSMTVAGIAILQICRQNLDLDPAAGIVLDDRLDRAWQWMAENRAEIGSPRVKNSLYFHYGLERAAILSDIDKVGDVDWYAAGAEMLLKYQQGSGGWRKDQEFRTAWRSTSSRAHPVDTAFAILFLTRGFQKQARPVPLTGRRPPRSALLPADAEERAIRAAADSDRNRGLAGMPGLLKCLRSSVLVQRKAATLAIFAITGQDFGLHPYRVPEENAEAIKRAELWWLRNSGK